MPKRQQVKDPLQRTPFLQSAARPNFYTRGGATPPAKTNEFLQLAEALSALNPVLRRYNVRKREESELEGQASFDAAALEDDLQALKENRKYARNTGKIGDIFFQRGRKAAIGEGLASYTLRTRLNEALRSGAFDDFNDPAQVPQLIGEINAEVQEQLYGDPYALKAYEQKSEAVISKYADAIYSRRNILHQQNTIAVQRQKVASRFDDLRELENPEDIPQAIADLSSELRNDNITNPSQLMVEVLRDYVKEADDIGEAEAVRSFLDDIEDTELVNGGTLGRVKGFQDILAMADNRVAQYDNDALQKAEADAADAKLQAQEDWAQLQERNEEGAEMLTSTMYDTENSGAFKTAYEAEMGRLVRANLSSGDDDSFKAAVQALNTYDFEAAEAIIESANLSEIELSQLSSLQQAREMVTDVITPSAIQGIESEFNTHFYTQETSMGDYPPNMSQEALAVWSVFSEGERNRIYSTLLKDWIQEHRDSILAGGYESPDAAKQAFPTIHLDKKNQAKEWVSQRILDMKPKAEERIVQQKAQEVEELKQRVGSAYGPLERFKADVEGIKLRLKSFIASTPGTVEEIAAKIAEKSAEGANVKHMEETYMVRKSLKGYNLKELQEGITEEGIPFNISQVDWKYVPLFENFNELNEAWAGGNYKDDGLFASIASFFDTDGTLVDEHLYKAQSRILLGRPNYSEPLVDFKSIGDTLKDTVTLSSPEARETHRKIAEREANDKK